ncbi:hypothetical protein OG216_01145 [Streptomycetaceae bacterium NBC_01309]
MSVPALVFGFGAHPEIDDGPEFERMVDQADRDGLDLFSLSDHPYAGARLDAYAAIGFLLGRTRRIAGLANVTNLPTRPAPMLARTVAAPPVWTGSVGRRSLAATGRVADGWIPGHAADWLSERYRTSRPVTGG